MASIFFAFSDGIRSRNRAANPVHFAVDARTELITQINVKTHMKSPFASLEEKGRVGGIPVPMRILCGSAAKALEALQNAIIKEKAGPSSSPGLPLSVVIFVMSCVVLLLVLPTKSCTFYAILSVRAETALNLLNKGCKFVLKGRYSNNG